ncbi:MAG: anti-sigma factor [Actinobacteria bacterium]|nr:anti-sigma factor [Actinomycetota bacterium]
MEPDDVHGLTGAYALDALDPADEALYEEHLRHCRACQRDLASLQGAAASLAYAVEAPEPPADLRSRILAQARAERPNVVPLRPRWAYPAAAVAAVAATAAIALGAWVFTLSTTLEEEREAHANVDRAAAVLATGDAVAIPLAGASGTLVVAETGEAALVVSSLDPAPAGKTYEAWVIEDGRPLPAGLFSAADGRTVVALERPVPRGAVVAVTLEPAGGVERPTSSPLFTAETA